MSNGYTPDSPEQWRPIPEFPGYFASDQGRIASTKSRRGGTRVLRPQMHPKLGYWYVYPIAADGVRRSRSVHGLVAAAFFGPRPEGQQVRHLDGNRANSVLSNLAYGSAIENHQDMVRHGRSRLSWTTCIKGHPFDEDNTYITPSTGARQCRTCHRDRVQAKKLAAANVRQASAA